MTQPAGGQGGDDDLQFSTVEPAAPNQAAVNQTAPLQTQAQVCAACKQPIYQYYYAIRDQIVCYNCQQQVAAMFQFPTAGGFFKALLFGLGAGIAGGLVWFAILYTTNFQIALIAIAIGYVVAKAVRVGSGRAGGVTLQIMAVLITYLSIGLGYALSDSLKELKAADNPIHSPIGIAILAILDLFISPIFNNITSPIGLFIVGIGFWEAWKLSSPKRLKITGPFAIAPPVPPAGSAT